MIKLNKVGQKAIYYTSPYFSHINLTGAYIQAIKWDQAGHEGVMTVSKNQNTYKIGLFPKLYKGTGNLKTETEKELHKPVKKITASLTQVGEGHFKLGYIYNLKQFD